MAVGRRMIELSILVATVSPRAGLLSRLLHRLEPQLTGQVEVLVHTSDQTPLVDKFNALYQAAQGRLSVQIDDDDLVPLNYLDLVLAASPGHDFVGYNVLYTVNGNLRDKRVFRIGPTATPAPDRWISPKCPILTRAAQQVPFRGKALDTDWIWITDMALANFPANPTYINRTLYHYDYWMAHTLGIRPEQWTHQRSVEVLPYDHRNFTWIE